jgi:hypothetical protein
MLLKLLISFIPKAKNSEVRIPQSFSTNIYLTKFLMHCICGVYFVFTFFYQKYNWNTA